MVNDLLTEELIDAGKRLVEKLDEHGFRSDAAVWLYSKEAERWRLYFLEPSVSKYGPRESYRKIQEVMRETPSEFGDLALDDISLAGPDVSKIAVLRTAVQTGPGIHGVRFRNNFVNGILIEDAYIYRLN